MKPGCLYIDAAVGSREFEPLLSKLGVTCKIAPRLPADFAWIGRGKRGAEWHIGVERKTLSDLGGSLTRNRLFGTQLPRMIEHYERIMLVVEGEFRPAPDDAIEVIGWIPEKRKYGWKMSRVPLTWSALQKWLMSYDESVAAYPAPNDERAIGTGTRWRTRTDMETARFLAAHFQWWQKPYEKHAGHIAIEHDGRMPNMIHAMIRRPNRVQKMAFGLDRVGAKTALRVGRHFRSIHRMTNASIEEWRRAGLGKKDAQFVFDFIREEI